MSDAMVTMWLGAVPLVGAAAGLLIRSRTTALKTWALLVSLAPLPVLTALAGQTDGFHGSPVLLGLFSAAAFVSILAQPAHEESGTTWLKIGRASCRERV